MQGIKNDPKAVEWIPHHQFGFREQHSTVQQTHRVVYTINQALDHKEYCTSVFLDIKQAFDKVWHRGVLYKIKTESFHHLFQADEVLHQQQGIQS
jgi:hypothetical protein